MIDKTTEEAFMEFSDACDELGNAILKELKINSFLEWLTEGINKLHSIISGDDNDR